MADEPEAEFEEVERATPHVGDMPALSIELTSYDELDRCQACGRRDRGVDRWLEADEHDGDQSPPVVVILCKACGDRLVEPHPRLYAKLDEWHPLPGSMPICQDCLHHVGTSCLNLQAQMNGGPGLNLIFPRPDRVHVLRRGKGQRSGYETIWRGPVVGCDGRETADSGET